MDASLKVPVLQSCDCAVGTNNHIMPVAYIHITALYIWLSISHKPPVAPMTSAPSRKRTHISNVTGEGLLHEFDQVAKRGRFEGTNSTAALKSTHQHTDPSHAHAGLIPSSRSRPSLAFLPCHLMMLRSLYKSNPQSEISDTTWGQIFSFLVRREDIQQSVLTSNNLSALLSESKSICTKPPLTAPLKRMNTSLKSESKMSFSFITQSQQGQIHSLSLNSPTASHVKREVLSPFYKKSASASTSMQKRNMMRGYRQKHKHTNASSQAREERTTFNSMNLVTSILQKRHNNAVQLAKREREPFLPLLENIHLHISSLEQELEGMKAHLKKEFDVEHMTEHQLLLAASGIGSEIGNDNGTEERNDIARIQSRLGLWMALDASLESVICSSL